MKDIVKISVLASLLIATPSCTDDFDEINTDPDAYTTAPTTNMLGDVLMRTAMQFGDDLAGLSLWSGFLSNLQYIDDYSDYLPTNNTFGNKWYQCYYGHVQLQDIVDRTDETDTKNMHNVALLWQNYLMSLCTDCFGDIPYSEAFKGAPEDGGVLETPYDEQSDIYPQILDNLKSVADSWAEGLGSDELGDGDFLFDGDVSLWQRFCNSLRLRLAIRISAVYSESQSIVEEIFNNPDTYPVIEECSQNAYFWWQGSGDYYERYYDAFLTRTDYCMSQILIDHLKEMEDPRLEVIALPCEADGEYRGGEHGYNAQSLPNFTSYSQIGDLYAGDPAGFSPFYKACETFFMEAEAALNGWDVPLTAEEAYETGVRLSMEDNGIDDDAVETYLAGNGKWDGTKDRLFFEVWVGLFKECTEAWTFYRRTGYPTYIQTALASDGVTKQYPGAKSVWGDEHTDVPFRMPYPDNQYQYNYDYVTEAAANVVDYCWGEQMWWDTRTGVK